jgi:hypothetical protein
MKSQNRERPHSESESLNIGLYDGTLPTFTTLKIKKSHDTWKDLEKTQKMSSNWAFYLKSFRNGGQLKLRYKTSQIPKQTKNAAVFGFHF